MTPIKKDGFSACQRFYLLQVHFSTVFVGQAVGLKEVYDKIWLVFFMDYDLGYFNEDRNKFKPLV